MDLKKFKPRDAVRILVDRELPVFVKTWALARLMAWMCLDQRRGTRKCNPNTGRPIRSNRRRRDAKLAGHLALASLLDRRFEDGGLDKSDKTFPELFRLFLASGGFRLFLESPRGARGWLSRMRRSTNQLIYVHRIVDYLCRHQKFNMTQSKFNIECAKKFIWKMGETPEPRTLGKYWETNKQAAPYIFAFYPFLASAVAQSSSIDQFVNSLEQLAKDQECLNQLLGHATYSADTLARQARNVRQGDFKKVKPVEPQLAAFTAVEIQIISVIDTNRPMSKKDKEHYRPETTTPPRAIQ